jgi:hypothetical protein
MGGQQIEMQAPDNPYRRYDGSAMDGAALMSVGIEDVRVGSGPGLLGADIDRIARQHHALGRREAEEAADARIAEMQRRLASAFDQGFAAGRVTLARGLARRIRAAIMGGPWFPLLALRDGPKGKAHEGVVANVVNELAAVIEALEAIMEGDPEAQADVLGVDELMSRRPVT